MSQHTSPTIEVAEPAYPAVRLIGRYGHLMAIIIGLVLAAIGVFVGMQGAGWGWAALGVVAGGFGYLMMRSYAELIAIITETLLPQ
jgi:fucose permease